MKKGNRKKIKKKNKNKTHMVGGSGGRFGERRLSVCSHPGFGEGFHHRLEIHFEIFGLVDEVLRIVMMMMLLLVRR